MVVTYLLLACLLVMLNGFFVLAEFAAVKMRPSRIKEWLDAKRPGAASVIHRNRIPSHRPDQIEVSSRNSYRRNSTSLESGDN